MNTVIGGLNADAPLDQTGPSIKVYLNDESFVEGGVVDQDANLLVFLEDEHGINTSLGAVGHQITAVIDGDTEQTIVLNDAYESEICDYKFLENKTADLSVTAQARMQVNLNS